MSRWINEKWLSAKINEDRTYKKSNSVRNKPLVFIISVIVFVVVGTLAFVLLPYFRPVKIQTKEYIYILKGNEVKISKYLGNDETVIIPDSYLGRPITSIGVECFSNKYSLESVFIPDTVSIIREETFYNCNNLKSVKAKNIVKVEAGAFMEDKNLQIVDLGTHLETIEEAAFKYCKSLEYVPSRDSLKTIGQMAFEFSGLTEVGDLTGVNIESMDIFDCTPWMENQTGDYVMIGDVLVKYRGSGNISVIPEGVKTIAAVYNGNPDRNISVYIPLSTTRIASYALIASEYYTVYIPKSVDSIVDINDLVNLDEKTCKIITVSGSYAEQYAKEHGMNYEIVDGWEVPEEDSAE